MLYMLVLNFCITLSPLSIYVYRDYIIFRLLCYSYLSLPLKSVLIYYWYYTNSDQSVLIPSFLKIQIEVLQSSLFFDIFYFYNYLLMFLIYFFIYLISLYFMFRFLVMITIYCYFSLSSSSIYLIYERRSSFMAFNILSFSLNWLFS